MRNLLLRLDPSRTLGKRRRSQEFDDAAHNAPPRACLALQHADPAEFADVVIITALSSIPFCCHEDLLTMPRAQLAAVARALNARLPAALAIDVSGPRTDISIRTAIELIVGLRNCDGPGLPAASATQEAVDLQDGRREPDWDLDAARSPPAGVGCCAYGLHTSLGSPRLARLEEEDESDGEVIAASKLDTPGA